MRHWSQLGIRNWLVRPGRTAGALAAIALGVGVVIWVTGAYESVRQALRDQVWFWTGRSHLSIESVYGPEGTVFQSLANDVAGLPNVAQVTARLKTKLTFHPLPQGVAPTTAPSSQLAELPGLDIQAVGIDLKTEGAFREYDAQRIPVGRPLQPGDTDAALVENTLAEQFNLKLGDRFLLREMSDPRDAWTKKNATFQIVGFIEHRRVAKQQLPIVVGVLERIQRLPGYDVEPKKVSRVDMILKDASPVALRRTELRVRQIADRYAQGFLVTSAEAKLNQMQAAEQQTGFVLLLISTVALFTAFFVILSTLSMGMVERVAQLGTLRCLGATRLQVAAMVLAEAIPLGVVGTLLGIPVGFAFTMLSVWMVPEYIGQFAVSYSGMALALIGGGITTLVGALLPSWGATRVSPLAASRPQSQPPAGLLVWLAALAGLAMIAGHSGMIHNIPANKWFQPYWGGIRAVGTVVLLYGGYALVTPALVLIVGQTAVRGAAWALRIRPQLLSDQVGRATWRSGVICCGLMVGLSLIVSLVVHSKSLAHGWDFPKNFCEAFVYVTPPVPRWQADEARRVAGAGPSAIVNVSTRCTIYGRGLLHFPISRFIGGQPDEFFQIAKLEFLQGNQADAIAKLKRGGYVLVTPEFTRSQRVGLGDKVRILAAGAVGFGDVFEIAGVVTSPALDIAANYFNAGGMLAATSAHVVLGTQSDLRRSLKVPDEVSMFLLNFDLPAAPPPADMAAEAPPQLTALPAAVTLFESWRPAYPERAVELDLLKQQADVRAAGVKIGWGDAPMAGLFREALLEKVIPQWSKLAPADRWRIFREELVMRLIAGRTHSPSEEHASVRALKMQIDRDLGKATMIFTTIPMVALIVAALGVGNLMMANVTSRTRQIAMLRAIGATKWQVTRLIIGEAVVLGVLGSLLGLALGLHAAAGMNAMTEAIWGYAPKWSVPWDWVIAGIAFTMGVCLTAGILPARHAARNNIISALQTT